jgi:hypothetical protein
MKTTLSHVSRAVFAFAILLAMTAASFAQQSNSELSGSSKVTHPPAPPVAFTTKAKLAISWTPTFGGVIRSKGVKSVSNPKTGVFCITPSVSLDLTKIYPLVSIEWGYSSGSSLLAYWRDTSLSTDCGATDLEVQTYDFNNGGSPVPSQLVAFDLVIE